MNTKNIFPPNTNPQTFSLIAVAIGYALTLGYTVNEQNSIGNWLILVGQYILTHAAQQQLIESRNANNTCNNNDEIDFLIAAINKINLELNNLKNKI